LHDFLEVLAFVGQQVLRSDHQTLTLMLVNLLHLFAQCLFHLLVLLLILLGALVLVSLNYFGVFHPALKSLLDVEAVALLAQEHLDRVQAAVAEVTLFLDNFCKAFNYNVEILIWASNVTLLDDDIILKVDVQDHVIREVLD
jgi:hypothetical protein